MQISLRNTLIASLTLAATALGLLLFTGSVLAQPQREACEGSGGTWNGTECTNSNAGGSLFGAGSLFESIVNVLLFVIGGISVIMLIIGGIRYVVSAGDANAVQGAKNTIMYSIVGVVVAFLSYALVNFVLSSL